MNLSETYLFVGDWFVVGFKMEEFGVAPTDNLDSRPAAAGVGSFPFAIVSNITLFFLAWSDPPGRPGRNPLLPFIDVIVLTIKRKCLIRY